LIPVKSAIPDYLKADKQKKTNQAQAVPIPLKEQAIRLLQSDTPILNYAKSIRDAGLPDTLKAEKQAAKSEDELLEKRIAQVWNEAGGKPHRPAGRHPPP